MRRSDYFWALILILLGVVLLLNNLDIIRVDVWGLVWPFVLIAFGLWILWGVLTGPGEVEAEEVSIPLEGAQQASVRMQHGAGRLRVGGGAGPEELLNGRFGGGLETGVRGREEGGELSVSLKTPSTTFPQVMLPWSWGPRGGLNWDVQLNPDVPLRLKMETGASESKIDLSELQVEEVEVQTGASDTELTLPAAAGSTRAVVRSGVAAVRIRVPSGVAVRIRAEGGLAGISVDRDRFPRQGKVYESPDYDSAVNKVDIDVETGVGSVDVR